MSRTALLTASLLLQLACAGRMAPSMGLSTDPRGTDVTLLPAFVSPSEERGAVTVQLVRPAYITIYEQMATADSLRRVYATPADSSGALDGTVMLSVSAVVRQLPGAPRQSERTREQCTDVPLGAGQASVSMCSANNPITPPLGTRASKRWGFVRPLVLISTERPYAAPDVIANSWFRKLDGAPPDVDGAWAALPFNMAVSQGTPFRGTAVGRR